MGMSLKRPAQNPGTDATNLPFVDEHGVTKAGTVFQLWRRHVVPGIALCTAQSTTCHCFNSLTEISSNMIKCQ